MSLDQLRLNPLAPDVPVGRYLCQWFRPMHSKKYCWWVRASGPKAPLVLPPPSFLRSHSPKPNKPSKCLPSSHFFPPWQKEGCQLQDFNPAKSLAHLRSRNHALLPNSALCNNGLQRRTTKSGVSTRPPRPLAFVW